MQRCGALLLMVVVGVCALAQQPQRRLQIRGPDTGVELLVQLRLEVGRVVAVLGGGLQYVAAVDVLGADKVRLVRVHRILGLGLTPGVLAELVQVLETVLPHTVGAERSQSVDQVENRWCPFALSQRLDLGDVAAQAAVHGAALGAEQDAAVDGGPGGIWKKDFVLLTGSAEMTRCFCENDSKL